MQLACATGATVHHHPNAFTVEPAHTCACRNLLHPPTRGRSRPQVDKDTLEMLKSINMAGLPGVALVAVSGCFGCCSRQRGVEGVPAAAQMAIQGVRLGCLVLSCMMSEGPDLLNLAAGSVLCCAN